MRLITSLSLISAQQWQAAGRWLAFTVSIGLLPLWGGVFLWVCGYVKLPELVDGGQLAIYTASFLAAGLYFVGRDFDNKTFPGRWFFILVLAVLLVLSSLLFSAAMLGGERVTENLLGLRATSVAMLVIAALTAFVVAALNEYRQTYHSTHGEEMAGLEDDYDRAGGRDEQR